VRAANQVSFSESDVSGSSCLVRAQSGFAGEVWRGRFLEGKSEVRSQISEVRWKI
jgi:hypothetical protein